MKPREPQVAEPWQRNTASNSVFHWKVLRIFSLTLKRWIRIQKEERVQQQGKTATCNKKKMMNRRTGQAPMIETITGNRPSRKKNDRDHKRVCIHHVSSIKSSKKKLEEYIYLFEKSMRNISPHEVWTEKHINHERNSNRIKGHLKV
ncbi:hypothetical protein H6P81_007661 [Aristolochia fimbriata]|uniref:Uncharacterized protein n=1 Tax=Aristolochia fimbriata TaxID=158543 RepID=A0AAV7F4P7_ARIFI|nr:hypothetical protein H6P81_007661 [Aristolochia fimbriata]